MKNSGSVVYKVIFRYAGILAGTVLIILGLVSAIIYFNRNKINESIEESINHYIQGKFSFDGVSFMPFYKGVGITFIFREVEVLDSVYSQPLMQVKRLGIRVSPSSLWNENRLIVTSVMLEEGELSFNRTNDGYNTLEIFNNPNKKGDSKTKEVIFPGVQCNVILDDIRIAFIDSLKNKMYSGVFNDTEANIEYRSNQLFCRLDGQIYFQGLVFNVDQGAFLNDKNTHTTLDFHYQFNDKKLVLNKSKILLEQKFPVMLSGEIQLKDSIRGKEGQYHLEFETDDIPTEIALNQLPNAIEKKITRFNILPLVDSRVRIAGKFNEPHPLVEVRFVTDTFRFSIKDVSLNRLRASGFYSSQYNKDLPPSDSNSILSCARIDGFFEQFPVRGDLKIVNFSSPEASINYDLKASIYNINSMLDPDTYRIQDGELRLIGKYSGDLKPLYDLKQKSFNGKVSGNMTVRNLTGEYLKSNIKIRNLYADVSFDEEIVSVHRMSFFQDEENSPLQLEGRAEGLLASLLGGDDPVEASMDIRINEWRLKLLEELSSKKNTKGSMSQDSTSYKLSTWIDRSIGNLKLEANLNASKLAYQKFLAEEVKGQLLLYQDKVDLKYFTLKAFDGEVTVTGDFIPSIEGQASKFNLQGNVKNADIKKVFYSLGNFGQNTLTDRNIEGLLQADFHLSAGLNEDASIIFPSVKGKLNFGLYNGKIKNFEPFLKIKKLIFKNRNLEDVQFEPIKSNVIFNGKEINVDQLKINSNVLSFTVDGIYSFGNTTNLQIRIPVSNFRTNSPRNGNGKAIYLKAVDQNGNVNIMLDGKRSLR